MVGTGRKVKFSVESERRDRDRDRNRDSCCWYSQDRPQAPPALPYTIQDQDRGHELELGPCFTDKAPRVGSLELGSLEA